MFDQLTKFHKTRHGYIVFGVIELLLLYAVASVAIDTASMFAYLASIILLVGAVMNFVHAVTFKTHPKVKVKRASAKRT